MVCGIPSNLSISETGKECIHEVILSSLATFSRTRASQRFSLDAMLERSGVFHSLYKVVFEVLGRGSERCCNKRFDNAIFRADEWVICNFLRGGFLYDMCDLPPSISEGRSQLKIQVFMQDTIGLTTTT